jgi:hypothetical protein
MLGDKACSVVFDNSKLRDVTGGYTMRYALEAGMRSVVPCVHKRLESFEPDPELDALVERIIAEQLALGG